VRFHVQSHEDLRGLEDVFLQERSLRTWASQEETMLELITPSTDERRQTTCFFSITMR